MKELILQKNNLHHAYLIEGDREIVFNEILNFLEKELNFSIKNNSDFWYGDFDTFGIDDGRKINELQSKKSFSGGKQIFIIKTNFLTREAQNSLLKMFEEPTNDTHFFVVMNSSETLLPTLKSRLMVIKSWGSDPQQDEVVKKFLKMNIGERMEFIKQFLADTKKDEKADRGGAIEFLNNLEKVLRERLDMKEVGKENIFIFKEISKCRNYLNDRSPSVKMLLENISIITPAKL